jgi:hypothetical protein
MSEAAPSSAASAEGQAAAQAAKRAEIEARLEALRLKQAKEDEQVRLAPRQIPCISSR